MSNTMLFLSSSIIKWYNIFILKSKAFSELVE